MSDYMTDVAALLPADLAEVIDRHDRGLEARDTSLMSKLIPEDFFQVTPGGVPKPRAEWVEWFENITRYVVMSRLIIAVRELDGTVAVVSRCKPIMQVRDGEPSEHQAIMLELWTKREGRWVKAFEQYTRPPPPSA